jgi:hypothetical protein
MLTLYRLTDDGGGNPHTKYWPRNWQPEDSLIHTVQSLKTVEMKNTFLDIVLALNLIFIV